MSQAKAEVLERSREFWNPEKTDFWQAEGVDLVIDRREGYFLYDMTGKRLIDVHLNGGTYNLGHRNPELIAVMNAAAERFDMGNHHFPAIARASLAEALAAVAPGDLKYTLFGAGGAEAVGIALAVARAATGRRKIVSIEGAYHGPVGGPAGSEAETVAVPFNDLSAMEDALKRRDVAGVIVETIPAALGFPMPREGYLQGVKKLTERYGALYIADEVQTGFQRTGALWGVMKFNVEPDVMVLGKALTGGLYPISACLISERYQSALKADGVAGGSTTGGAEIGCCIGLKVLEITQRPEVASMVRHIGSYMRAGLDGIRSRHADWFTGIRQHGLVMGLEFAAPEGARAVTRHLYNAGLWAIYAPRDPSVLHFKPGILLTQRLAEETLRRLEVGIGAARAEAMGAATRRAG